MLYKHLKNSLSREDKVELRVKHEPLGRFPSVLGNNFVNTLEYFYQDPTANDCIFQNYSLDIEQKTLEAMMYMA